MKFNIKCETLLRLSSVTSYFEPNMRPDVKEKINTIRLQNISGKCTAVVTNEIIAVVEFLNFTDQPDGYVDLILSNELIQQCETENSFGSKIHINSTPDLAITTLSTDLGWQFKGNASHWFDESPLDKWKNWFPEPSGETTGVMQWDAYQVETLAKSSPSGQVVFPEFIDLEKPVILRDIKSSNWVGSFMPTGDSKPAKLPDWW